MGHAGFIIAAYALTGLILAGLLAWIMLDGRGLRRLLAELDAQGVRRRSAGADRRREGRIS